MFPAMILFGAAVGLTKAVEVASQHFADGADLLKKKREGVQTKFVGVQVEGEKPQFAELTEVEMKEVFESKVFQRGVRRANATRLGGRVSAMGRN